MFGFWEESRGICISNTKVAYKISNWVPVPTIAKSKDEFGGCLNTSLWMDFQPTSLSSSFALEYLNCKMKIVRLRNKNKNSLLKFCSQRIMKKKMVTFSNHSSNVSCKAGQANQSKAK